MLYAGLAPVVMRARIDRLGAEAREALGLLGAYVTETIQGLSDLVAFQAVAGRRDGFMDAVRDYQKTRLTAVVRSVVANRAAGDRHRVSAASRSRSPAPGWWPTSSSPRPPCRLLILLALASFLPISEIAQVSRQLADTIASTRRLYAVHRGRAGGARRPLAPAGAGGRLGDRLRGGRLRLSRRASAGARRRGARHPGRRDGGDRRPVRRRQDDPRQSAAAVLGPGERRIS